MADAALDLFVHKKTALRVLGVRHVERRRALLARVHDSLVADLVDRGLDQDLATIRADMVIKAVLEAMEAGRPQLRLAVERLERQDTIGIR